MRLRGFTLIEVLTVITIFGLLVTLTSYVYASALSRSRDQTRLTDLKSIGNALEQFYLDHKEYPDVSDNPHNLFLAKFQLEPYLDCQISGPKNGYLVPRYMSEVPQDPRQRFIPLQDGASCNTTLPQTGQYVYVTSVKQVGESPKTYILAAKMERNKNMSREKPTDFGIYQNAINNNFVFCTVLTKNPNCSHNFYLQPKPGG